PEEDVAELLLFVVRPVAHAPAEGGAGVPEKRVKPVSVQLLPRHEAPVVDEDPLELRYDGAPDTEVKVLHPMGVSQSQGQVAVPQVHSAREAQFPIDNQELPMVAEVEERPPPEGNGWRELGALHLGLPEEPPGPHLRVSLAKAI